MAATTYRLTISYDIQTQFAQNILHYSFDDSGFTNTTSAALALCTAFNVANTTALRNILSVHTSILSYKGRSLSGVGGFEAVLLLAGPPAGTRGGNMSVAAVSPVAILFPIANAKPRGRIFLPGVSDSDLSDGDFTTGYRTAFTTNRHIFTDTLVLVGGGGPTATPVIYSRLPLPSTSRTAEYCRLSEMAGTQRRRQRPA